jgi:hypothetical protein
MHLIENQGNGYLVGTCTDRRFLQRLLVSLGLLEVLRGNTPTAGCWLLAHLNR